MKILVVEDEHKIANAIKKGLQQESFAVDVVYDADDGLASARADEYDVIILDRMLPGDMDGVGVCKALRAESNHTPILMLTAKGAVRDRVAGLDAGADDYLVKPFAFEELLARVRALLRRPQDSLGLKLEVGELSLDTTTYEVRRGDTVIDLSQREFALLEYLMRNKGRTLSKEMIIQHVWSYDADVLFNTVEVYIGYLRNKIDRPFRGGAQLLKTVRGFGYKLDG